MDNLAVYQNKLAASGFRVFERAITEARRLNHNYVSLGHILIALDAQESDSFRYLVGKLRANHGLMAETIPAEQAVGKLMELSPRHHGKGVRIGPETKAFLRRAMVIARSNGREKIEAADLLSAFLQIAPIPYARHERNAQL
jgi:ATP-dependent Clp protease ATP-binding subunit ClpA